MSRGLGKVERTILEALGAHKSHHTSLSVLCEFVAGLIGELGEDMQLTCTHKPIERIERVWIAQTYHDYLPCPNDGCYGNGDGTCRDIVGWTDKHHTEPVTHDATCYPSPTLACQRSVARAVRSLERRGLVNTEIQGYRAMNWPRESLGYWRQHHPPHRAKTVWLTEAWAIEHQHRTERKQQAVIEIGRAMAEIHASKV